MHILLVEDDVWLADLYKTALVQTGGFKVTHARSADAALTALDENQDICLIILDMYLPAHNGIEFLHEMGSYADLGSIPVFILSSVYKHDFGMSEERWRHYGVVNYLYKPQTKPQDLLTAVKKQLSQARKPV